MLADVIDKFRYDYGLCPSHYLRAPYSSRDGLLKLIKVVLKLILDPDMFIFFEKGGKDEVFYGQKQ